MSLPAIRQYFQKPENIDHLIFILIFALFAAGLNFLFSAYVAESVWQGSGIYWRGIITQTIAFCVGLVLLVWVSRIDTNVYFDYFHLILVGSIASMGLLFTPLAVEINNATRWIDLQVLQFQPSEIMKLGLLIFFAALFSCKLRNFSFRKAVCAALAAFLFLGVATHLQPDYGTAVLILVAIIAMAFVSPVSRRIKIFLVLFIAFATSILFLFAPDYVSNRLSVFYDVNFGTVSQTDRYGDAFHALQNLETVEKGGLRGGGLYSLAQRGDARIPELTTDSIFALVASEIGFIGSTLLITAFLFLFFLLFTVAQLTRDPFAKILTVGIVTLMAAQFFLNILVVLGFNLTGVPFIFFSRGGSSLVITMVAIGIIRGILLNSKRMMV